MIFNILLTYPKSENLNLFLKEAVSWDFVIFFSWIKPIWVPDKQSKIISSKNSFSKIFMKNVTPRSVTLCGVGKLKCPKIQMVSHCAESDSVKHHTARSPTPSSISNFLIFNFFFRNIITKTLKVLEIEVFFNQLKLFDSAKCDTVWSPTLCSITLRGVWLRTVWDHFGFLDLSISWLCAVWHCAESCFLANILVKKIF